MVNQAPVLNMVNSNGTVYNNLNINGRSFNIENHTEDINIIKIITGKHTYYINDRNNLYKKLQNGTHLFIRNRVYDITMNDETLYFIDLRYRILFIDHDKIKNKNWKYIPNKDRNKFKSISANKNTLWAIDIYNNVYKIENNKDITVQPNVYLESISTNGENVYGLDIHNNLHQYIGDGWTSTKITTKGTNIRDIAVGTSKIYGINKEESINTQKGFFVDGKYIIDNCNITRECTDNTYCKNKNYCCQKGSWVKGMCSDVSSYKGYIGNIEQNKTLDECVNLCKQTEGCNLYNYSNKDKNCYLYSSLHFNNPSIIPHSEFESGRIQYNNNGTVYYCSLPCDGEFMRTGSLPQVNSLSFGSANNDNHLLKDGMNIGYNVDSINNCTLLKGVNNINFVNTIVKSDYIYGFNKGDTNYYGCNSKASFLKADNKNIIWKKSMYTFPKYSTDYTYHKSEAKDICNIYGLKQCSLAEIKNKQQCACGWVSDYDKPTFYIDDTKGCNDNTVKPGYNTCDNDNQKAYTYCCGSAIGQEYSMCPANYPFPVSTIKALPIYGGLVKGEYSFCCNSSNNEIGKCNGEDLSVSFANNNAVACANPPCKEYVSSVSTTNPNITLASNMQNKIQQNIIEEESIIEEEIKELEDKVIKNKGIWDSVNKKCLPIENFMNLQTYHYMNKNRIPIGIILCLSIIILIIIYNFKY